MVQGPHVATAQPLPHVLILHTGGTLGMDAAESFEVDPHDVPHQQPMLKRGTGGKYRGEVVRHLLATFECALTQFACKGWHKQRSAAATCCLHNR